MTMKTATTGRAQGSELMALFRAIAAREVEEASRLLAGSPGLARQVIGRASWAIGSTSCSGPIDMERPGGWTHLRPGPPRVLLCKVIAA